MCKTGISFSRAEKILASHFVFFVAFSHGCLDSSDLKNTKMTKFYISSILKMQSKNSQKLHPLSPLHLHWWG